jgi:polyisoprenyl-phosphate glycosyltransferase
MHLRNEKNKLSIVVPVYKSEQILPTLYERLLAVCVDNYQNYELIFVCDASPDASWSFLSAIAARDSFTKSILLRKNVGYDRALMAGFSVVSGDYVVTIDDDLQHSPEDIPILVHEMEKKNFDVVFGWFQEKKQSRLKNIGSWCNDKLACWVLGKPKDIYLSPFKAFRRDLLDFVKCYDGPFPYVDGLLLQTTSALGQISLDHHGRFSGSGNYNFFRSLGIVMCHLTGFSVLPLRFILFSGALLMALALVTEAILLGISLINLSIVDSSVYWSVFVVFISGFQLLSLGFVGEYIGRAYMVGNKLPQFVVKEQLNVL